MAALGLLILRLVVGLIVAAHGAQKVFGWWEGPGMTGWTGAMNRMRIRPAAPWAWLSAVGELAGGILFALGLLSPLGSIAIAGSMLVAIALVHLPRGFWVAKGGYEFNLSVLAAAVAVALTGPGALSLDAALRLRPPEPVTVIVAAVLVVLGVGAALLGRSPQVAETSRPRTV